MALSRRDLLGVAGAGVAGDARRGESCAAFGTAGLGELDEQVAADIAAEGRVGRADVAPGADEGGGEHAHRGVAEAGDDEDWMDGADDAHEGPVPEGGELAEVRAKVERDGGEQGA